MLSAVFGVFSANAAVVDCGARSVAVKKQVVAEKSKVLEIVSNEVTATPTCSCEIVKAAIQAFKANAKMVAAIVEVAAIAAPDQLHMIAKCAIAVAPDASAEVQAVVKKLDPGFELEEVAEALFNPLDFAGSDTNHTIGLPMIPQLPPSIIAPPGLSNVNPG